MKILPWLPCALFGTLVAAAEPRPPNVVLILADDLGWKDLTSYGSDLHLTPHLDRLAREGMSFTQAYSACTVCSPTRAAILTGQHPARLHVTDWIAGHRLPHARLQVPEWTQHLDLEQHTLAEALRDAGYATGHFGKWHLGATEDLWPEHHGFDVNVGGWRMGQPSGTGGYFSPYGNPRLSDGPPGEHLDERLAREAAAFIAAHRDQPFFVNFWLYNPHTPLQADPAKVARYRERIGPDYLHRNATYAAMIEHLDDAVGIVLAALDHHGLAENTLVVFTSDNGGLIGRARGDGPEPTPVTSNQPLRHGKGERYEGGVRVPLIVRYPPLVPAATTTEALAFSTDFYPTVLALTDVPPTPAWPTTFDGINLSAALRGEPLPDPRDTLYWHYPHYHTEGAVPYSAIRRGHWKLVHNLETDAVELYDLAQDIGETDNLAAARPDLTVALRAQLATWLNSVGAQYPTLNPDYDPARARFRQP
jgi:arylsulfatase A